MNITSTVYWQVSLNQVTILGANSYYNQTKTKVFTPSIPSLVLDSGSTFSYIPTADYYPLFNALFANSSTSCIINGGIKYCSCANASDPSFLNISLALGGRYVFYFNNSDYLRWDTSS